MLCWEKLLQVWLRLFPAVKLKKYWFQLIVATIWWLVFKRDVYKRQGFREHCTCNFGKFGCLFFGSTFRKWNLLLLWSRKEFRGVKKEKRSTLFLISLSKKIYEKMLRQKTLRQLTGEEFFDAAFSKFFRNIWADALRAL